MRTTTIAILLLLACSSSDDGPEPTTSTPSTTTTSSSTESSGDSSSSSDTTETGSSSDGGESTDESTTTEPVIACELTFPAWGACDPGCACDGDTTCLIGHTAELGYLAFCAAPCESDADCDPDPDGRATSCVVSANLRRCAVTCTPETEATDCPPAWHCYSSDLAAPARCMPGAA